MYSKIKLFVVISPLFLFLCLPGFNTRLFAQDIPQRPITVRVGFYENPPKLYTDEDGVKKGFWPEIIEHIAFEKEWQIEYVDGTFSEGLSRLLADEIDVMMDVGYSKEREEIYNFSAETAFINWASVYSSKGTNINSLAEFEGKNIAVLKNDIHHIGPLGIENLLASFSIQANFIEMDSYAANLKAVNEQEADLAVVNRVFGTHQELNYPNIDRTSIVFNPIELRFAYSQTGAITHLIKEDTDSILSALKSDSDSLYYRSIISNLEGFVRTVEVSPNWVRPVVIAALGVGGFSILTFFISRRYQAFLKNTVRQKTEELLKSEIKFKELTDLLPQTVFEAGLDGVITYINNMAVTTFGYSRAEFHKDFNIIRFFSDKEYSSDKLQIIPDLFAKEIEKVDFTAATKHGEQFYATLYYSHIMDSSGAVLGLRGIIFDISDEKKAQSDLNEKVDELEAAMRLLVERGV